MVHGLAEVSTCPNLVSLRPYCLQKSEQTGIATD